MINDLTIKWELKKFSELTLEELYEMLKLRIEVFVVEQNCVFQDCDDKDQEAWHLMGWRNKKLLAYSRLLAPGKAYDEMSIGRVVTSPSARRAGIGSELMKESIVALRQMFGEGPIHIGAQLYLEKFYNSLGFRRISPIYLEDGIEHVEMILK